MDTLCRQPAASAGIRVDGRRSIEMGESQNVSDIIDCICDPIASAHGHGHHGEGYVNLDKLPCGNLQNFRKAAAVAGDLHGDSDGLILLC